MGGGGNETLFSVGSDSWIYLARSLPMLFGSSCSGLWTRFFLCYTRRSLVYSGGIKIQAPTNPDAAFGSKKSQEMKCAPDLGLVSLMSLRK